MPGRSGITITAAEWRRAREMEREYQNLSEFQVREAAEKLAADCHKGGWTTADGVPDVHAYLVDLAEKNPVEHHFLAGVCAGDDGLLRRERPIGGREGEGGDRPGDP